VLHINWKTFVLSVLSAHALKFGLDLLFETFSPKPQLEAVSIVEIAPYGEAAHVT